jgi:hypothetical protein
MLEWLYLAQVLQLERLLQAMELEEVVPELTLLT